MIEYYQKIKFMKNAKYFQRLHYNSSLLKFMLLIMLIIIKICVLTHQEITISTMLVKF